MRKALLAATLTALTALVFAATAGANNDGTIHLCLVPVRFGWLMWQICRFV